MKKRLLTLLLAAILAMSLVVPVSAAFSDVPADAWYAGDVADVQQYGIIEGVGNNKFLPNGILTHAQAVTMASRVYARMNGDTIPDNGGYRYWYEPYLEYARSKELLDPRVGPDSYDDPCSRSDMAWMFYRAIQGNNNTILNNIDRIPDLSLDGESSGIYALYRFGILTGSDEYGSFYPDRSITRAETAAILNRVLDVDKRQVFTLKPGSLFHSLDFSRSWTNVSEFTDIDYEGNEYTEDFYTTIAFQPDGKLYGIAYIPYTDDISCFQGSYKLNGDKIIVTVSWNDSEPFTSTYRAEPTSHRWEPGFVLIFESGDTFMAFGTESWIFWNDGENTAAACKDKCLQFWGIEPE